MHSLLFLFVICYRLVAQNGEKKLSARSVGTWELASSHHYQCADGLVYGWYLLYLARELPVHNSSFYFDFR